MIDPADAPDFRKARLNGYLAYNRDARFFVDPSTPSEPVNAGSENDASVSPNTSVFGWHIAFRISQSETQN